MPMEATALEMYPKLAMCANLPIADASLRAQGCVELLPVFVARASMGVFFLQAPPFIPINQPPSTGEEGELKRQGEQEGRSQEV